MIAPYDDRRCLLGEGPLWHPERKALFWFDIIGQKLLSRDREWPLDEVCSAAGWIDRDTLLVASDSRLLRFDLTTGRTQTLAPLEADRPGNRSNDGRADPWGGFWIGTMGRNAETGAGAIYRYHQGRVQELFGKVTIPNAICFAPDRTCAYFADSAAGQIRRVALDENGWPQGEPVLFRDLDQEDAAPDGAVTAADGTLWNAQWGGSRIAAYAPDGRFVRAIPVPPRHVTCPAFGGSDFRTLFVTSAQQGIAPDVNAAEPANGQTFALTDMGPGLPEHRVVL